MFHHCLLCRYYPELIACIKSWLTHNIADWKDIQIVPRGKYLGFFLGRDGARETYSLPCKKYLERVEDIGSASAPSLVSVLRYNERAATVFSFVSQVIPVHDPPSLAALEQRGVHKVLKLPPNSMSRKLMHSLEPFHCKSPAAIISMCRASMYRLARREAVFLRSLHEEILEFWGDSLDVLGFCKKTVPNGGISDQPIVEALLDALHLRGDFAPYQNIVCTDPNHSWIADVTLPPPIPLSMGRFRTVHIKFSGSLRFVQTSLRSSLKSWSSLWGVSSV